MSTSKELDELDELFDKYESLASSLHETQTIDTLIEANKLRSQAEQIKRAYLKSKKESNDRKQTELDELHRKEKELEEQLKQKRAVIRELEQQRDREIPNVEKLNKEYVALLDEVQAMEWNDSLIRDDTMARKVEQNPTQLQLALYRGLGITLKVDKNERVTEAALTSVDNQDIRIISLDDKSIVSTANRIWDFIS